MYYFVNGGAPNNPGFNALPDYVQKKIIANMMYGGMRYQDGGEQEEIISPEDMETYNTVSQTSPGRESSYSTFVGPQYQSMGTPTPAASSFALNPYQGVSVWDFLTAQGKSGDLATRKKIANELGISNYTGRRDQNKLMMEMIMQNPDVLLNVSSVGSPKKGAGKKKTEASQSSSELSDQDIQEYLNEQANKNPYVTFPSPLASNNWDMYLPYTMDEGVDFSEPSSSSSYILPAAAVTGAGLGVYGASRAMAPKIAKDVNASMDFLKANIPAKDIIGYAKKFGKDSETFNILRAKGMNPKDINIALKGIRFNPNATQQIALSLKDMTAITGQGIKDAGKIINQANLDRAKKIVEVMKLRGGFRDPKLVNQIYKLVANPAEANALMKGLKFMSPSTVNATRATVSGVRGLLPKLFKREEGGELEKYQPGGIYMMPAPITTGWFDSSIPDDIGEDIFELLDVTGVSSWDDIKEMHKQEEIDPDAYSGFGGKLDKALTYLSAVPAFGEVGKIGKGTKNLFKYILGTEKAAEKLAKAKKAIQAEKKIPGKVWSSIKQGVPISWDIATGGPLLRMAERSNPATYATSRMWEKGLSSLPGGVQKVVRPVSKMAGSAGRFGRSGDLYERAYNGIFNGGQQGPVMFKTPSGQIIELLENDPRYSLIQNHIVGADPETGVYYVDSDSPYSSTTQTAAPAPVPSPQEAPRKTKSLFRQVNRKNGGSYSGTYSAGVYYQGGGSFDSSNYTSGSPLPKFNYGSMMAKGGQLDKYQIKGQVSGNASDNTSTRYMTDAKTRLETSLRNAEMKKMMDDYYGGFKPSYNFSPYYREATPGFLDSSSYRYSFQEAPKLFARPSRVDATPAAYGWEGYKNHEDDTDLEWLLNEGNPSSYVSFLREGKDNLVKAVDDESRAYIDWLKQAKTKYYDSKGNIKSQYKSLAKKLKLPTKFPSEINTYADGGSAQEMYVTPEEMEMLRQQGYDFDVIG